MLGTADDWEDAIGSAILSGINGDRAHTFDPGKHLSRSDNVQNFGSSSWPVVHPKDKIGPSDKACALDISMNRADQNRVHNNFITLYRNRAIDPRAAYVYAFNGYNGSGQPMRYNLVNGATSITDSSHTWHEHVETFYAYVNDPQMRRAILSVVRGESIDQYRGVVKPAPEEVENDEMSQNVFFVPAGFAFDETETLVDRRLALSIPTEPAGHAGNPIVGSKHLFLSLSGEFTEATGVKIRVAIHNGGGWSVKFYTVKSGGRIACSIPDGVGPTAYNISVGRMKMSADASEAEADAPVSILVTIA